MSIKWRTFEDVEVGDRVYIADVWRTVEQVGTHEAQGNPEIGWIAGSYEPQEEGTTWQITVFPDEKVLVEKQEGT